MKAIRVAVLAVLVIAGCTTTVRPSPSPIATPSSTTTPIATPAPTETEAPTPTPSPVPTRTQIPEPPPIPSPCDGQDPKRGIAQPEKFTLVDRCRAATGVVASADKTADGSVKLRLSLDYGQAATLNLRNMTDLGEQLPGNVLCAEPVPAAAIATCGDFHVQLSAPAPGAHVTITGPLVLDVAGGFNLIQPVWGISVVVEAPPSIPATVVQTKQLWAQIREKWPMIPPAVVLQQSLQGAVASASLYPDGIAHVFVGDLPPEAHVVWHEAGHVLHAAALKQRGKLLALYTNNDDVGAAFWAARGFPGSYQTTLTTGSWGSLGYEALAEAFAAVNVGDAERTVTYSVPLDRSAMRVFFANLFLSRP